MYICVRRLNFLYSLFTANSISVLWSAGFDSSYFSFMKNGGVLKYVAMHAIALVFVG